MPLQWLADAFRDPPPGSMLAGWLHTLVLTVSAVCGVVLTRVVDVAALLAGVLAWGRVEASALSAALHTAEFRLFSLIAAIACSLVMLLLCLHRQGPQHKDVTQVSWRGPPQGSRKSAHQPATKRQITIKVVRHSEHSSDRDC